MPTPMSTPRLQLTTTGARSGQEHTVTLGFRRRPDDGAPLIVASDGDRSRLPDWYGDVLAHPMVRVQLDGETFAAIAVPYAPAAPVESAAGESSDQPAAGESPDPAVALKRIEPQENEGDGAPPQRIDTLAAKLLEVHTWLRAQLRHLRTEADAHLAALADHQGSGEPPAPGLGMQIRQHCLAFCDSLAFHHSSEDAHLFPAMADHHPHLREALDRLREEHLTVARLKDGLLALLADAGRSGSAQPQRFRAELDRMNSELLAHLDYEEESLLPALAEIPWPPAPPAAE
ncbi:nitroreductase/quinone reductase family protein [Streptomyces sp. MUM 178J]|uniref:nitroreductase/quinone reductase family protein n=1 Tax=Streptomyces sp. MUM 178J TaxID=2791991 RepID=UPI001F04BEF3|nr:nitroreductase/quinone reductase family protein [Streptomyces sp. MUM 178J]WRQ82338.1 nitroreductase/quinone reductase family protein [Streptomyces sp. MUM 178J]